MAARQFLRAAARLMPHRPVLRAPPRAPVSSEENGGSAVGRSLLFTTTGTSAALISADDKLVPNSISMLTTNNISVPPQRLLEDLDWSCLATLPDNHQVISEAQQLREQLEQYARRGLMVSPDVAVDMIKRFFGFLAMRDVHAAVTATPDTRTAINESLGDLIGDLDTIDRMSTKIRELQKQNRVKEAHELAERACSKLTRLQYLIDEVQDRIAKIKEEDQNRLFKLFGASAGLAVLFIAAEYYQVASPSAVNSALQIAQDIAGAAFAITLSMSIYQWYRSSEAREYCERLNEARLNRNQHKLRIERLLDELLMESL